MQVEAPASSRSIAAAEEIGAALDARRGFQHATVVEVDAVAGDVTDRQPVAGFEVVLCQPRAVAEQLVMAIEPVEGRLGDGS